MYILIMNLNEKNLLFEHTKNMHTVEKVKIFYDYEHTLFYKVLLELNILNVNKLIINN